ncbi:MAG: co-chaperone GroES [Streptococcaceae bacterium]|nr:co-chaperone GroES [Streptococcaceae bacterium]
MLKPLSDRVVLKIKEEEKTIGGLVFAPSAQEKPQIAEVIAVGSGTRDHGQIITPEVAVGDVVVFDKYSGVEVKDGGEVFLVVKLADLIAVVE